MYSIVTFGPRPRQRAFRQLDDAIRVASRLPDTTTVRIYECGTEALARSADISTIRDGERTVWAR